jgi:hypothetical protein
MSTAPGRFGQKDFVTEILEAFFEQFSGTKRMNENFSWPGDDQGKLQSRRFAVAGAGDQRQFS